jgi:nucleotide-binding universal stress UspA family protein
MKGSIRQIVVAMDNSQFSLTAAHWGARLAAAAQAQLLLVHVVDVRYIDGPWFADICGALGAAPYEHLVQSLTTAMTERGTNILMMGEQIAAEHGVKPATKLVKGLFVDVIQELTRDANLLVLGRRGDDYSTGSHLLGTAGERAIRQVACSCLVVPERWQEVSKMVVGVNDSGPARAARQWAEYLRQLIPTLTVVPIHVRQPHEQADFGGQSVAGQPIDLRDGQPEMVLAQECAAEPERTICVIGATGHTRTIKELILGTLTFHLLHKVKSPVLITR